MAPGKVAKLTPENYRSTIDDKAKTFKTLYVAVRPFEEKGFESYNFDDNHLVEGHHGQREIRTDFANAEIMYDLRRKRSPTIILQDSKTLDSALRLMKNENPFGDRYFVPTFRESINPIDNIGNFLAYLKRFGPAYFRIIAPANNESEAMQLKGFISRFYQKTATLEIK